MIALLASAALAMNSRAQGLLPEDASAPLRRFPVSIRVRRAGVDLPPVSLLRLGALRPGDDVDVRVGDRLTTDWTFVSAQLAAGQKARVQSWNLWDKRFRRNPIHVGKVPDGDVVPLFFLVLNRRHDGRAADAIKKALETSSGQIVSATQAFTQAYDEQDRVYCLLAAYSSLGAKAGEDPEIMRDRLTRLGADLGVPIDPKLRASTPTDLRRGLMAGLGVLTQLRKTPDDPTAAARIAQSQLPGPIAEWLGLMTDLMRVFIKPRRELKMTFVPASAGETSAGSDPDEWMDLITERVLETKDGSAPALVYKPMFDRAGTLKPAPLAFERRQVLSNGSEVAIPLAPESRDLYTRPLAWDWRVSFDGKVFMPGEGAKLVPGRGLVLPTDETWWAGTNERTVTLTARLGQDTVTLPTVRVARVFSQAWTTPTQDLAVGDSAAVVSLSRSSGTPQPYYIPAAATLTDSVGRVIPGGGPVSDGDLRLTFDLRSAAPGFAQVKVQQEEASSPDAPVTVFIAPRRPSVGFTGAARDNVVRAVGPDARYVQAIAIPSVSVLKADDSVPGERSFVLSGPIPADLKALDVTYQDPSQAALVWKRRENLTIGAPRPHFGAALMGLLTPDLTVGPANDPSLATATLPAGWFRTKQPVRINLGSVPPFRWSHDVALELGLGSAADVQPVVTLPEGSAFAIDLADPRALVTLNLDAVVPPTSKRRAGILWFRVTRGGLASEWTLAKLPESDGGLPLRAVRTPSVLSVDRSDVRTRVTLGSADDVLSVKFAGQEAAVSPVLVESTPAGITAYVDGPAGATDLEIVLKDAPEGVVKVKLRAP